MERRLLKNVTFAGDSNTDFDLYRMSKKAKREVAKDPNTPVDVLVELATDIDGHIRSGVAGNPNTPVELLKELSKEDTWNILWQVAGNPNTPVELLAELAKHENEYVRWNVADNPNATDQVLVSVFEYERSRNYPEYDVLYSTVKNSNCPGYLKAVIQTILEVMR
jgi:hypothetical protein